MPVALALLPRSCVVAVPDCADTSSQPDPLLVLLFAVVAIGLVITVVLSVRRRQQLLRDLAARELEARRTSRDDDHGDDHSYDDGDDHGDGTTRRVGPLNDD